MHSTIGIDYHHRDLEDESILWSWNRQRELSPTRNQISQHSCSRCRWPKYLIISLQIKGVKGQIFWNAFLPQKIFIAGKIQRKVNKAVGSNISLFSVFDSLSLRSKTLKQMQIFGIWNIAASEILTWNVCKKRNIMFQRQNPECFQPLNVCIQRRWESWRYFPAKGISPKQNFFWIFCNILLTFYLSQTNDNNKKQKLDGY